MFTLWLGGGSLGMLFAAKMSAVNRYTLLITRTTGQGTSIRSHGVKVYDGTEAVNLPLVACKLDELGQWGIPGKYPEWIMLAIKQKDLTESLVAHIHQSMGPETNVLCFQNGMGHVERLSAYIPLKRIYLAVTTEAALKRSDCEVVHTGKGITWLGPVENVGVNQDISDNMEKSLEKAANLIRSAGFRVELSNTMDSKVWNKIIINAVINPLTAILRIQNGELINYSSSLAIMRQLYDEASELARRLNVAIDDQLWDQVLLVCKQTAANRSSMLQDLLAARETEIDWINGALLQQSERIGYEMNSHRVVYSLVKSLEASQQICTTLNRI